jgi:hypothetical protein
VNGSIVMGSVNYTNILLFCCIYLTNQFGYQRATKLILFFIESVV